MLTKAAALDGLRKYHNAIKDSLHSASELLPASQNQKGGILDTVPSTVDGGFWLDVSGDAPTPKFFYDGEIYPLVCGEKTVPLPTPDATKTLNDYTWAEISAISKAGKGADYFNIGDCKEITLNGKIGDCLTLNNEKLCVYILHFNYPMNGTAENNIIWGGFKTADGTDVALCDSRYESGSDDGKICFNMNHAGDRNYGGWKGCDLRYDILGATSFAPSDYGKTHTTSCVGYDATSETLTNPKAKTLLAALPSDMRNILRLWSRWIDAKGNCSNDEANIEETIDAITLLTEFEVHGAQSYANQHEQNHQTQMDYYKNGNAKSKVGLKQTSNVGWWQSSPHSGFNSGSCAVQSDGTAWGFWSKNSYALAPAFKT